MPTSFRAGDVARQLDRDQKADAANGPVAYEQPAQRAQRPSSAYAGPPPRKQQQDVLVFYPAYTFPASPTYHNKWVKLTCHEIHNVLKFNDKYAHTNNAGGHHRNNAFNKRRDAPLLFFYLNHPIQYTQIIGIVVAVEEYYEKFWLFTVDDSSGCCLDVTCPKPEKAKATTTAGTEEKAAIKDDTEEEEEALQSTLFALQIGTVVQAKGQITTFRQTRQLFLLRLTIVPSTTTELALIASRTEFHNDVLSKPWVLSEKEQKRLQNREDREARGEREKREKRRRRERLKIEREQRHRRRIEEKYAHEEEEREKQAEIAKAEGESLKKEQGGREGKGGGNEEFWVEVT
jgi:hypothetical protein